MSKRTRRAFQHENAHNFTPIERTGARRRDVCPLGCPLFAKVSQIQEEDLIYLRMGTNELCEKLFHGGDKVVAFVQPGD
jgi:hypothetical protein